MNDPEKLSYNKDAEDKDFTYCFAPICEDIGWFRYQEGKSSIIRIRCFKHLPDDLKPFAVLLRAIS